MSVPVKYRELGDFPEYYSGRITAPILTIFIGGNHEASSHLWELYYGGWVAPNIYYLGFANVLRFGPIRIAGMSGIWKGFDYNKPHIERLPFNQDDIKGFYHVREIDVRKLLLLREQVDVGLSHDWPRAVERYGDEKALWRLKPDFRQESLDGTLGNPAATYVMDRLRPAYWFSAHMHCKFSALKKYDAPAAVAPAPAQEAVQEVVSTAPDHPPIQATEATKVSVSIKPDNPDEIDLDMDDDDEDPTTSTEPAVSSEPAPAANSNAVSEELRAQLPASFTKRPEQSRGTPGQPVPPTIFNTKTRFLALDKCTPGRKCIQLACIKPITANSEDTSPDLCLQYDPEWLAINRVFHQYLQIGDRNAKTPVNEGEAAYNAMIDKERAWVDENIVAKGQLTVPLNFAITAPPHNIGDLARVNNQPEEYTSPQTAAYCQLLGLENLWDATPEERAARQNQGPPPEEPRRDNRGGGFRGGRGGRGGGRGGGGFGRGHRGGRGRGRGRG
jgi:lariat debranching enzyme